MFVLVLLVFDFDNKVHLRGGGNTIDGCNGWEYKKAMERGNTLYASKLFISHQWLDSILIFLIQGFLRLLVSGVFAPFY